MRELWNLQEMKVLNSMIHRQKMQQMLKKHLKILLVLQSKQAKTTCKLDSLLLRQYDAVTSIKIDKKSSSEPPSGGWHCKC